MAKSEKTEAETDTPDPKKAKPDAKKGKADKGKGKGKDEKGKKGKKGKGGAQDGISVAGHPRAAAHVKRAKGWGGLLGFAIAAYLSHKAGVPAVQVGVRALVAGVAGYLVAWACAVSVWRHLLLAELRAYVESGRGLGGPAPAASPPPVALAAAPDGPGE
jgi:hypothetical protein